MQDYFDATGIPPIQGGGGHPVGKFPCTVTNTYVKPTQANDGGMLVVELTSAVGKIENRYNLFNKSEVAVKIAQQELSALCHATGRFKITFPKDQGGNPVMAQAGAELRGAQLQMEVGYQKGHNPATDGPEAKGYVEVKKVYDAQGNEPGKAQQQPQPGQQAQPAQQANGGGWGGAAQAQPQTTGWTAPANATPATPAPAAAPANSGGWSPGPTTGATPAGGNPPWAK